MEQLTRDQILGIELTHAAVVPDVLPPWLVHIIRDEGRLMLTDHEAARLLGVSRGSVRQAIAQQEIQVCRLGRRLLIPLVPLLNLTRVDLVVDSPVSSLPRS